MGDQHTDKDAPAASSLAVPTRHAPLLALQPPPPTVLPSGASDPLPPSKPFVDESLIEAVARGVALRDGGVSHDFDALKALAESASTAEMQPPHPITAALDIPSTPPRAHNHRGLVGIRLVPLDVRNVARELSEPPPVPQCAVGAVGLRVPQHVAFGRPRAVSSRWPPRPIT
jgi:hypothetical protein